MSFACVGIGFDAVQQREHGGADAFQRLRGLAFKAQYEHGGGVAGADEAEAVGPVHAQAVNGADARGGGEGGGGQLLQLGGQAVRLAFGAAHVQLGRAVAAGQGVEYGAGAGVAAEDFKQAAGGVGAVVKAVPALFEEDVAAHFAAQRGVQLFHAGLDERVAGLVHHRHAARRFDGRGQALAAFHVEHDVPAGRAGEHVLRKEHELPVGEDGLPVLGDDAQAVAVAVKGQAQLGIGFLQGAEDVAQVFGLAGVGVVVGKAAIHVGEQLDDFAADGAQDAGGRCAGNAVAAVHHDFQGARHGLLDLAQPGACALA